MVSVAALRCYVLSVQGFTTRLRRAGADEVAAAVRRLSCVQLDSIAAVERSHRIVLGSRVGVYPRGTVSRLLGSGRIFEYWAHEACLLPIEDYPLLKWRMERLRDRHPWRGNVFARYPGLREEILKEIEERGALGSRHFGGEGGGGMWNWKPAKEVLEALYSAGELAIAGRAGFQRLYDLPSRVIPPEYLHARTASEDEFRRGLALRAVRGRGALTEYGIAEHCRFRGGARAIRPHVDALVAGGKLRRVAVADAGPDVLVPSEAELDASPPRGGILLSPFDNVLWDRAFVERLFGFRHVIEVYKREHERVYGYYVLPFLHRDRIVGRADLRADRREGVLRVRAFHLEPKVRPSAALDEAFERALARLGRTIGLSRIER